MSNNPYQSPMSYSPTQSGGPDREKARCVAKSQRNVMFALLANIASNIALMATMPLGGAASAVGWVLAIVVVMFCMYAVFSLASVTSNPFVGVVCAMFVVVPCVSLVVLLVINQRATSYLQSQGIKVGFLGADPNSI